jgi:hypothetical protein
MVRLIDLYRCVGRRATLKLLKGGWIVPLEAPNSRGVVFAQEEVHRFLSSELNKLHVESCPFFYVPTHGRSHWDQGLTPADLKRCHWLKPQASLSGQVHGMDAG